MEGGIDPRVDAAFLIIGAEMSHIISHKRNIYEHIARKCQYIA